MPPASLTEAGVKRWLNSVARSISSASGQKPKRAWNADFANVILPDEDVRCKPDIILINNLIESPSWKMVKAVVEVTSRSRIHSEMKKTINNKTYLIFSAQHTCRFVPFLAICKGSIRFIVTDRDGQAVTNIEYLQKGPYHALNFIRIIVALMFASEEVIGFDPTVSLRHNGSIRTIAAGDKVYAVKSTVHAVRGVIGRSTRVWSAYCEESNKVVVIKDGWVHQARAMIEEEHLMKVQEIRGVPKLVWGGTVKIHDPADPLHRAYVDDDTAWIRHDFSDDRVSRVHRRLVLYPVGEKLSSFTSLGELIAALRDIVIGMFPFYEFNVMLILCTTIAHKACCGRGVLHRDISFNNILLVHYDNDPPDKARQGMLIDFDYAATTVQKARIEHRTVKFPSASICTVADITFQGTPPFMAIALLLNGASETDHYAKYDLESIMYVLFYCATMLKGLNDCW